MEAGLHFDAEAIFFLTDGVPQGGNINNPADIVASLITRANSAKTHVDPYHDRHWRGRPTRRSH